MTLQLGGGGAITGCTSLQEPALTLSGLTVSGPFDAEKTIVSSGTAAAPSYTFSGDTDNGLYYAGTNSIGLATAGTNAILIDSTGNVGIGLSNPGDYYPQSKDLVVGTTSGNRGISVVSATTGTGSLVFADGTGNFENRKGQIVYDHSTNSLELFTDQTERLRIDSSGKVGIGTSSPTTKLEVTGDVKVVNTGIAYLQPNTVTAFQAYESSGPVKISLNNNGSATFAGNVGINQSSPDTKLDVSGAFFLRPTAETFPAENGVGMRIRSDTNHFQIQALQYTPSVVYYNIDYLGLGHRWHVNGSEKMRIDSSGRLLVGTSSLPSGSNTNLLAAFGKVNSGTEITSISVGSGSYRIFNAMVPAVIGSAQTTATLNFQFAQSYGIAVIEIDLVGGLAQIGVGKYVAIVDCDTSSGQTAQLSATITTVTSVGYGSPVFSSGGASVSPSFSIAFTRSSPNGENWGAYWKATVKTSSNSHVTPCVLTSITMS